jgi:hypothetical protein
MLLTSVLPMSAQCDSIPVIMDAQGGFTYSWCTEEWTDQEPTCYDIACPLLNPCTYQSVCFTLDVTTTLPYIFTMDSEIGNMWLDDGVNCSFKLMDENCEQIFIAPCWNNWSQGQTEIVVDSYDDMDPFNNDTNEPNPWNCCSGDDWQITIQLPLGTYNFCVNPSVAPENEGQGCMTLTIFSPPILGLSIEEYKKTGYYTDRSTAVKLRWLGW